MFKKNKLKQLLLFEITKRYTIAYGFFSRCDETKPSGYTSVKATFRKNTTSFELDGEASTQMEVKQLVKTYNIQV